MPEFDYAKHPDLLNAAFKETLMEKCGEPDYKDTGNYSHTQCEKLWKESPDELISKRNDAFKAVLKTDTTKNKFGDDKLKPLIRDFFDDVLKPMIRDFFNGHLP